MKYLKPFFFSIISGLLFLSACTSNTSTKNTADSTASDTDTIATIEHARPAENAPVNNDIKPDSVK